MQPCVMNSIYHRNYFTTWYRRKQSQKHSTCKIGNKFYRMRKRKEAFNLFWLRRHSHKPCVCSLSLLRIVKMRKAEKKNLQLKIKRCAKTISFYFSSFLVVVLFSSFFSFSHLKWKITFRCVKVKTWIWKNKWLPFLLLWQNL